MNDAPQTQAEKEGLQQAAPATGEGSTGREKMSRYTVQLAVVAHFDVDRDTVDFERAPDGSGGLWQDIAVVEVPMRSQRKTAVAQAISDLKVPEDDEHFPMAFRAIDEEAGEIFPVTLDQPPAPAPTLRIGA